MAELAVQNIKRNNLSHKITVLSKLSTDLQPSDLPSPPTVLVSELFGTLLLGESALDYIHDARQRLLAPNAKVIPPSGCQIATLIEVCPPPSGDQGRGRSSHLVVKDTRSARSILETPCPPPPPPGANSPARGRP